MLAKGSLRNQEHGVWIGEMSVGCAGGGTSLEDDCRQRDSAADPRLAAVLSYRIERRALAKTGHALLTSYIADRGPL